MGALVLLLVGLVSIDDRVRERITNVLTTPPSTAEVVGIGTQIEQITLVVAKAAHDQSVEQAPMMIFAIAATVLVLFMLRT
jgi:hypothetical protein